MAFGGSCGGVSLCMMGVVPLPLMMLPVSRVLGPCGFFGNMMDKMAIVTIPTFAMCKLPPFPKPCMPSVPGPWIVPKVTVMVAGKPAFDSSAKAICALGGIIEIKSPTQPSVMFG